MPRPRAGDWLSEHEEAGQSLRQFLNRQMCCEPHASYRTVLLVPIGWVAHPELPLAALCEGAAAFFGLPVGTFWLAATSNSAPVQANVRSNTNASNEAALIEQLLCKVKALAAGFSINPAPIAQRQ